MKNIVINNSLNIPMTKEQWWNGPKNEFNTIFGIVIGVRDKIRWIQSNSLGQVSPRCHSLINFLFGKKWECQREAPCIVYFTSSLSGPQWITNENTASSVNICCESSVNLPLDPAKIISPHQGNCPNEKTVWT